MDYLIRDIHKPMICTNLVLIWYSIESHLEFSPTTRIHYWAGWVEVIIIWL